jgi:phosphatidylserine/phosphatidylglycerophosphate/cardiolipin synthase-like enzyme/uncharacterized membrane protein YdjX (TVP38/TMEM64 family)
MGQETKDEPALLQTGKNCWRSGFSGQVSLLIDCANYYSALHDSICKARHSIFILGWDIDSRIELLRGKDAENSPCPVVFFDLIQWKARQNPDLMIYLNRWEFSLLFASQRECLSNLKWRALSPVNVHYSFDGLLPVSACHHQKVIVIDDEIAFCGGMDVAIARWDHREHHPDDHLRADPGGVNHLIRKIPFGPYHDIQCVVSGDPARHLADWCRERWRRIAGFEPIPLRAPGIESAPFTWPRMVKPDFQDVQVGIAMTLPVLQGNPAVRHVEQLYLDMIARAEDFIYIENQYLTSRPVAEALNRRLREKPDLRVLIASCFESNGIIEKKSMWTGRLKFREILESGNTASRVTLAYPISREHGDEKDIRIHSKVMIVDDKFLRVGSSNLNNRSMGLDTECDLVIVAGDEKSRRKIAKIRNDLIREHTGRDMESIEKLIRRETDIGAFLNYISSSNQHFRQIDDERFRQEKFAKLCISLGDPVRPFIPPEWSMPYCYAGTRRNLPRRLVFSALLMILLTGFALFWPALPGSEYVSPEKILPLFDAIRHAVSGFVSFMVFFTAGGLFLPVTTLIIATAILWGPVTGFYLALSGTLLSAAFGFGAGRVLGLRILRFIMGPDTERLRQFARSSGLPGMIFLRLVPLIPFTTASLGMGLSKTPFLEYMAGTLAGMLPRIVILMAVGDSLTRLWKNPDSGSILYVAASMAVWFSFLAGSHVLVRRWQEKKFIKGYICEPGTHPLL